MHVFSFAFPLFVVLAFLRCGLAGRPHRRSLNGDGELVERQVPSASGNTAGTSGGIIQLPTQPQNVTSTAGSTNGAGNGSNTAAPGYISQPGDVEEVQVDCRNLTTGRANRCWAELDLSNWVQQWVSTNQCYESEGFSSCFLRSNGFPGLDCSQIAPGACTAPQYSVTVNLFANPEIFYVAYNIYGKLTRDFRRIEADSLPSDQPIFLFVVGSGR